jgi:RNA polymerase sigma factor (sigma-70 family)
VLAEESRREVLESRFRSYYEENYRSIRRYITRLSGDSEEAGDLAQEAFARLWRELEKGEELVNPRAWLYRVASNLVINRAKVRSRTLRHERQSEKRSELRLAPNDIERQAIHREVVSRALGRLPEPMRQCLLLYHEGLTGKEIAAVLGVKSSYVGTLVIRAHERFRRECEAEGGSRELLR